MNSAAWGVYATLYTYYLETKITNDSETRAMELSTYSGIVYSVAIFLVAVSCPRQQHIHDTALLCTPRLNPHGKHVAPTCCHSRCSARYQTPSGGA